MRLFELIRLRICHQPNRAVKRTPTRAIGFAIFMALVGALRTVGAPAPLTSALARMKLRVFIADRILGALGIAGLFALQSAYELVFCGGGVFGFWEVTLILVVPPVLLLLISDTRPALVSCAVLIPFILLANGAECAPYRGGGAAMGYVPALLFGMPLSFIAGVATAIRMFLKRRRLANAS